MFGQEAIAKHVYNTLRVRPEIQAVLGNPPRITAEPVTAPDKQTLPYLLHYAENAPFEQEPVGLDQEPNMQTISYLILFVDRDTEARIRPAYRDAEHALVVEAAHVTGITLDDDPGQYELGIRAGAEWPGALGTTIENGVRYRRKGLYLSVNVSRAV